MKSTFLSRWFVPSLAVVGVLAIAGALIVTCFPSQGRQSEGDPAVADLALRSKSTAGSSAVEVSLSSLLSAMTPGVKTGGSAPPPPLASPTSPGKLPGVP
jgi:hypothetical protein